jgi:hypothetical protein
MRESFDKETILEMKKLTVVLILVLTTVDVASTLAQNPKYPPSASIG